jgi:hypothetical protein
LAQAGLGTNDLLPKINTLGCCHQFQGENALHIIQNGPGFECRRTAHADVILDIGRGGNGIDAGWMG